MSQAKLGKFNGFTTVTVRVPVPFRSHCDELAKLLSDGCIIDGIIVNPEGNPIQRVQFLQDRIERSAIPEPKIECSSEPEESGVDSPLLCFEVVSTSPPLVDVAVPEIAIASPPEIAIASPKSIPGRRLSVAAHSALGASLLMSRQKVRHGLPVTAVTLVPPALQVAEGMTSMPEVSSVTVPSVAAVTSVPPPLQPDILPAVSVERRITDDSRRQTFGKRVFRTWRTLALELGHGHETPWSRYVDIEQVYRREFAEMQGTTFLALLSEIIGSEVSFGGILQLNESPDGVLINEKSFDGLTFALVTGESISVPAKEVEEEESDVWPTQKSANPSVAKSSDGERNKRPLKLQQLCKKLIPGVFGAGMSFFIQANNFF